MIAHNNITMVLDVGAHTGQYARRLRRNGYSGHLLSFEPLKDPCDTLRLQAAEDPAWDVFHTAIGSIEGQTFINVAANSYSSSLLPMLDTHISHAPESAYIRQEAVSMTRLDAAVGRRIRDSTARVLLKVDTQGFEHHVIESASGILGSVMLIECELSLVPLYEGQHLWDAIAAELAHQGFGPVSFESGFSDVHTGYCLQADVMFARVSS